MDAQTEEFPLVVLAIGVVLAVIAVLMTYLTFPPDSGPDRGGFSHLFLLIFPTVALAGVLSGYGLATFSSRVSSRLTTSLIELLCVSVVSLGPVGYGRFADPEFFDLGVIKSWLAIALSLGVIIITIKQGVLLLIQLLTSKRNGQTAASECRGE